MRWLGCLCLLGCLEPVTVADEATPVPMAAGETRTVELRFLAFEVQGYQQTLTLDDLRAVPKSLLDEVWLLDLPLQRFAENSLAQLRDMDEATAGAQPVAVQNMRKLMNMTPDNADLRGTNLEALTSLSVSLAIPPQRSLSQILQKALDEPIISLAVAAEALVGGLIGSHPAAQLRHGPVDAAHPDGMWPVTPGHLPVTLGDVVDNFTGLTERFGPAGEHPGYIVAAQGFTVTEDAFQMKVRVNGNALPYKGIDLTDGSVAAVNSVGGQIDTLFATDRDDWLEIEGLVETPTIQELTVRVTEWPAFVAGGDAREPVPTGNSEVWALPPWTFERLVAEMGRLEAEALVAECLQFGENIGAGTVTALEVCVEESGWMTFETFDDAGDPPAPSYLWDIQLEMAQVRLHDQGLAEGEAEVQLTIHDVELGVRAEQLTADIRRNIAESPRVLREFAGAVAESTRGAADFYYYRATDGGEWLYFVHPTDIPRETRGYGYATPGFFADEGLTQKLSATTEVDGDAVHEKVALTAETDVFLADDAGQVFRVQAAGKPSRARVNLAVTRVR